MNFTAARKREISGGMVAIFPLAVRHANLNPDFRAARQLTESLKPANQQSLQSRRMNCDVWEERPMHESSIRNNVSIMNNVCVLGMCGATCLITVTKQGCIYNA